MRHADVLQGDGVSPGILTSVQRGSQTLAAGDDVSPCILTSVQRGSQTLAAGDGVSPDILTWVQRGSQTLAAGDGVPVIVESVTTCRRLRTVDEEHVLVSQRNMM